MHSQSFVPPGAHFVLHSGLSVCLFPKAVAISRQDPLLPWSIVVLGAPFERRLPVVAVRRAAEQLALPVRFALHPRLSLDLCPGLCLSLDLWLVLYHDLCPFLGRFSDLGLP